MKRYFNSKVILILVLAGCVSVLSSCLKNNKYYVDFGDYKPSIELPFAAKNANKPFAWPLDVSSEPQDFLVYVNVASMNKPSAPVTATLALDQGYLDEYNAQQDAAAKQAQADYLAKDPNNTVDDDDYPADYVPYKMFPDSLYTIDKMEVTVPAGERQAYATVKIVTEHMDFNEKYVLPFTIASVSPTMNISSWNHLLVNISAKNEWDGKYNMHLTIGGSNAYAGTVQDSKGVALTTTGPNSVAEPGSIVDFFGGYTEYTFNADGSVGVLAGGDASNPNGYGAVVKSSSYDESDHSFNVVFTILGGKYIFTVTYTKQ